MRKTGLLIKRTGKEAGKERLEKHEPASLREASVDSEGFYLKVDTGNIQIYLLLNVIDVGRVISEWSICLAEEAWKVK